MAFESRESLLGELGRLIQAALGDSGVGQRVSDLRVQQLFAESRRRLRRFMWRLFDVTRAAGAADATPPRRWPGSAFRSADVVRFVTATRGLCGLCGPISRTNHGQPIKNA